MPFAPKAWLNSPLAATPLNAAALVDLETRLTGYTDQKAGVISVREAPYNATGNGTTDDQPAIQAAINALGANGGTLMFPEGSYRCASPLNVDNKIGVIFRGAGGVSSGAGTATQLIFSGSTGPLISAQSTFGFQMNDIQVLYTNASFTGNILDFQRFGGTGFAASYPLIQRCFFGGSGGASSSAAMINFNQVIIAAVRDCRFGFGQIAIKGRATVADYSNVVLIDNCTFGDQGTIPIQNPGQSWMMSNCTFEPLIGALAGAMNFSSGMSGAQVTFENCWCGDATAGGTWVQWAGASFNAIGNYFGPAANGIIVGGFSGSGVVKGNQFEGCTTGVSLAANCTHWDVTANSFTGSFTTAISTADSCPGSTIQNEAAAAVETRGTPSVQLTSSGHQDTTTGTDLFVVFDTEEHKNVASMHSTAVNTSRIVAPFAGIYMVFGFVPWATSTTGARSIGFRRNGTTFVAQELTDAGGTSPQQVLTAPIALAAGDYLELRANQSSGANLLVVGGGSGGVRFGMTYVGSL